MSTSPATVVYTVFSAAQAGAEMVLLELVSSLDRQRFRPVVVTLAGPGPLTASFEAAGVEIHHLGLSRAIQAPTTLLRAWRLVRRLKPDLVHGVLFYGDVTARLLRAFGATPHVVTWLHSTYVGGRGPELAMRLTDHFTDAVTAVSLKVADAQIAARSISPTKVSVIENGIDFARFQRPSAAELAALRSRFGIGDGDRVLLCVGRLAPEKNHALLLRSFASVSRQIMSARLLLVGTGPLEAQM